MAFLGIINFKMIILEKKTRETTKKSCNKLRTNNPVAETKAIHPYFLWAYLIFSAMAEPHKNRYAVVTGANKGIGFEICRQLASNGVFVVLTARDEKKGLEALEKLKGSGLSDLVLFHQLDVVDPSSVASLADFIKNKFGRLDILVNNAGTSGAIMDWNALQSAMAKGGGVNNAGIGGLIMEWDSFQSAIAKGGFETVDRAIWARVMTQTYELAEECLQTNYYGAKRMVEAFIPLLELSDSPRIVNVSSSAGKLQNIPGEWIRTMLNDVENLTEEMIDELMNGQFLQDFTAGSLEIRGWPFHFSAYTMSKAAMNAYTRIMAKQYPSFRINSICPGYVKTDINDYTGYLSVEEGAEGPVKLALLPDDGPCGLFFIRGEVSSF